MAKDDALSSLFGKAKKWAQDGLKNAVSMSDPVKQRAAEEQHEQLGREIESDAQLMRDNAIEDALTPQSIKDYRAYTAAQKAEQDARSAAEARAARQERASASSVELSGEVTGRAEGLAVESFTAEDGSRCVNVECVDPVPMAGGTVRGFCFAIPAYHGDGRYELLDTIDFNSLAYELYLVDADDGWGFHPSFGPGVITVTGDVADVSLVLGSVGTETIQLHATVVVPPPDPI